ncbi:MAG TPA: integrase arm-type DNA-binding domain-containing protein [Steroidobacteraceae bacterium]|jgi:hypothetical protein|nr:integrase arm-type DNA-binding domain-containing protein [Steroidobacteraceae bacterium]
MSASVRWCKSIIIEKYRFAGKEKRISLGVYPDVGLKKARDRRDEMRRLVADGIDPSAARKQEKLMALNAALNTFEAVAREWFKKHSPNWEASYSKKLLARLEANIFPWLGHRPIRDIKAPELLSVLRRVESRGVLETAHRFRRTRMTRTTCRWKARSRKLTIIG